MTDEEKAPSAEVPTGLSTAATLGYSLPSATDGLLARLPFSWRRNRTYQAALNAYARTVIAPHAREARNPDALYALRLSKAWRAACAGMACKRRPLTIQAVTNDLAGIAERGQPPQFDFPAEVAQYLVFCAAAGDEPPFELTT